MKAEIEKFIVSLKSRNLSEHTIKAYQKDLGQLEEFLRRYFPQNEIKLSEVRKLFLRDFLRDLNVKGCSNRSLSRKVTTIKGFFRFCHLHEMIPQDPAEGLKNPKFEKTLPKFFTEKEMTELLDIPDL